MNDLPPCDLAAEQRLLGHLLADNRHLEGLWWLSPGHFVDPLHALIFAAILERVEAGQLADAATLRDVFAGTQVLEEVGGAVYLTQLVTVVDVDDQLATEAAVRFDAILPPDGLNDSNDALRVLK